MEDAPFADYQAIILNIIEMISTRHGKIKRRQSSGTRTKGKSAWIGVRGGKTAHRHVCFGNAKIEDPKCLTNKKKSSNLQMLGKKTMAADG